MKFPDYSVWLLGALLFDLIHLERASTFFTSVYMQCGHQMNIDNHRFVFKGKQYPYALSQQGSIRVMILWHDCLGISPSVYSMFLANIAIDNNPFSLFVLI